MTTARQSAYCKEDILVVLACVAFLLLNLAAIGSTGRRRAKEAVCRSNLHQWGVIFQQFADDNGGYFFNINDPNSGSSSPSGKWIIFLRTQYRAEPNILRCPEATERFASEMIHYGDTFNAYDLGNATGTPLLGKASYGANCWIYRPTPIEIARGDVRGRPLDWHWKTPHVRNADKIPVFADTMWRGGGPTSDSGPPVLEGQWTVSDGKMKHFCINRHNGGVNILFMDWSVRKVGLKELWKLKWHREFDTDGPWTSAGGVRARDWPEWMKDFKDY